MVPFYGWGSTTSRLRSIYEEGICFLPFPEIPSPSSLPVNFSQKFRHHFYALLADNILISFIQPFCSLKHITFVIIPQQNVSKSFSFFCIFGLVNSPSSLFLCLQILLLACVSLFPFLPQFTLLTNNVTNIIIPAQCFLMSSWAFCPSLTPVCSLKKLFSTEAAF